MLTTEESRRFRRYLAIQAVAGGDITVLTAEESRDLISLMEKWLQQQESHYPQSTLPEPYQRIARGELRKIPTWKLEEAYEKLKGGEPTGIEIVEENRAYAISAVREILWERGKLPQERGLFPMLPGKGPPLPRGLNIKWPWEKEG